MGIDNIGILKGGEGPVKTIPIVDNVGKPIGEISLNEEAAEVLKTTGLSLLVDYDPKLDEVIGYLH